MTQRNQLVADFQIVINLPIEDQNTAIGFKGLGRTRIGINDGKAGMQQNDGRIRQGNHSLARPVRSAMGHGPQDPRPHIRIGRLAADIARKAAHIRRPPYRRVKSLRSSSGLLPLLKTHSFRFFLNLETCISEMECAVYT